MTAIDFGIEVERDFSHCPRGALRTGIVGASDDVSAA